MMSVTSTVLLGLSMSCAPTFSEMVLEPRLESVPLEKKQCDAESAYRDVMRVAPHLNDSEPLEDTATTPNIQGYLPGGLTSSPPMIRAWIGSLALGSTCVSP